jgi:hypothetical protein
MSSAKGFPAVPFLTIVFVAIWVSFAALGTAYVLHCRFTVLFLGHIPYQTLNNNDSLVPVADIVCYIVIMTTLS